MLRCRYSCRDYANSIRKVERASKSAITKLAKPCPKCKMHTEKDGGCNHMVR
jgi:hypothetical protein